MNLRKPILVLLMTLVTNTVTAFVSWRVHAQTHTAQTTAFNAIQREIIYKIPSAEIYHIQTSEFSRKTDGSEVDIRARSMPTGEVKAVKIIVDVASGHRTVVDGTTESVTTYVSEPYVSHRLRMLSACVTEPSAQQGDNILGYNTVITIRQTSLPYGGKIKVEAWMAPKLGCFPLRQKTYVVDVDGVAVLSNEREVLSVKEGDPPPDNFTVPRNFTERSPSGVMAEYNRRYPDSPNPVGQLEARDKAYLIQQQKK